MSDSKADWELNVVLDSEAECDLVFKSRMQWCWSDGRRWATMRPTGSWSKHDWDVERNKQSELGGCGREGRSRVKMTRSRFGPEPDRKEKMMDGRMVNG